MAKSRQIPLPPETREFRSVDEIDVAITKLQRRIAELEKLDVQAAYLQKVIGFHVDPLPESVETHNRFTLLGKEPAHYVVLLLSLAAFAFSVYGVIASLRTSIGKKKWLWAAVCLVGVGRLATNWTTGAVGFTPLWIGLPPSGAAMVPLYSPWIVYSSLPIGTVAFLMLKDRLTRPLRNSAENPSISRLGQPQQRLPNAE